MEFRDFVLKDDINQLEYVSFRTSLQELRPSQWETIMDLPIELFYYVLVVSAVKSGWIQDVVEKNKYNEEETWSWTESGEDYVNGLGAGKWPWNTWGEMVFDRWTDIRTLDPN